MSDGLRDRLRSSYAGRVEQRAADAYPAWKRSERDRFLMHLRRAGARRLLEVGAGTGRDAAFFRDRGIDVVCVDLSSEMVAHCRGKGLDAREMDIVDLRFPDVAFDAAYSFNSLLHLPKVEFRAALQEIGRVLRPNGLFYLGQYGGIDREEVWEDDDYVPKRFFSFYSDEQLLERAGALFDVVSFHRVRLKPEDGRLHFQSLLLRRPETDRELRREVE